MEKLGEINVEQSLSLTLNYTLDQSLLASNLGTILEALKELQRRQEEMAKEKADGDKSLLDQLDQLRRRMEKMESKEIKEPVVPVQVPEESVEKPQYEGRGEENVSAQLQRLKERVQVNEKNIMGNTQDINLINKDLSQAQKDIEELKTRLSALGSISQKEEGSSIDLTELTISIKKTLENHNERIKELEVKLLKMEEAEKNEPQKDKEEKPERKNSTGGKDLEAALKELRKYLKDELATVDKKLTNLQSESNQHSADIQRLKLLLSEKDNEEEQKDNKEEESADEKERRDRLLKEHKDMKKSIEDLRKKLQSLDKRQQNDVNDLREGYEALRDQIDELRRLLKINEAHSKTSIDDERSNKKIVGGNDLLDRINQLELKLLALEKSLIASKQSLSDEKNPEKLPAINRPKRNIGSLHEKEKTHTGWGRRDLAELKAELQAWIQSLLQENKDRDNMEDLHLKIQEIKRALEKKADGEGTKKGFSFLENKITQLYLFLTEPDTEDAMIVRKGFNCLSCSKKVEKLRGRLGPRVNWNNMTSTNYSPPKVGYSKPMGEMDQKDDL